MSSHPVVAYFTSSTRRKAIGTLLLIVVVFTGARAAASTFTSTDNTDDDGRASVFCPAHPDTTETSTMVSPAPAVGATTDTTVLLPQGLLDPAVAPTAPTSTTHPDWLPPSTVEDYDPDGPEWQLAAVCPSTSLEVHRSTSEWRVAQGETLVAGPGPLDPDGSIPDPVWSGFCGPTSN